ncbi:putative transposase [Cribrihabitans marinus]|uniref:Putative transposase n=1 Tax=Cribrihabitans marinus TaxID=1227549 RepID=A0A1H7CXN5_9RHOB|nr:transposase [Cribrihabitans marinus]GGH35974.1 transposase [Cribrihabitans marinus]SEJ90605.1 putative transposase [Cribrihabitans marinus]
MTNYRRARIPGVKYFFTVALADRESDLLIRRIHALRRAFAQTLAERPFWCDACVVLPNHLHTVWTLPPGDADFSTRWGAIKSRFTRDVKPSGRMGLNPILRSRSKVSKGDAGVWQRRFWEHCIRNEEDYRRHMAYCWYNPVKHGLSGSAVDWPYSSIHRDIRAGRVAPGWSGACEQGEFGEP